MNDRNHYMRDPGLVTVTGREHVLFLGRDGVAAIHPSRQGAQWSALLQQLAKPVAGSALRGALAELSGDDVEFLERLVADGLVLEDGDGGRLAAARDRVFTENTGFHLVPSETVCAHLVVGCTGSVVAGLMAPTLLSLCYSRFQQKLDVVLTRTAERFLTRDLLESYGIRTWVDGFERRDDIHVPHVHLGRSADCVLVLPASANSLHRLADGACTDLLSTLVAATTAPVVLAPVMNDAMWNHAPVQRNVQRLRDDGMFVIEPTVIFGAADLAHRGAPMYGGHGTIWAGPRSLMRTLEQILLLRRGEPSGGSAPPC